MTSMREYSDNLYNSILRTAEDKEKTLLVQLEGKRYMRDLRAARGLILIALIMTVASVVLCIDDRSNLSVLIITLIASALIMGLSIPSINIHKRHLSKIEAGDFRLLNITITGKPVEGGNCYLEVLSDNNETYRFRVDKDFVEELRIGSHGIMAVINGERKTILSNPFRFIGDQSTSDSDPLSPGQYASPSDSEAKSIAKRYNEIRSEIIGSILIDVLLLSSAMIIMAISLPRSLYDLYIAAVIVTFLMFVIITNRYARFAMLTSLSVLLPWGVWLLLRLSLIFIGSALITESVTVRAAAVVVGMISDLFIVLLPDKRVITASCDIYKGAYKIRSATVNNREVIRHHGYRTYYVIYSLNLKDEDGLTYDISVSRKQYKRTGLGYSGHIVRLDRRDRGGNAIDLFM